MKIFNFRTQIRKVNDKTRPSSRNSSRNGDHLSKMAIKRFYVAFAKCSNEGTRHGMIGAKRHYSIMVLPMPHNASENYKNYFDKYHRVLLKMADGIFLDLFP